MRSIPDHIEQNGGFLRRRDLLAAGYTDRQLTSARRERRVFRVRQGWYSTPRADQRAVRAVRVGGRLTGIAALESYGIAVPRRPVIDLVVARNAERLRSPDNRAAPLRERDRVRVHWTAEPGANIRGTRWRVSIDDALLHVLRTEGRDIAVACCDAVLRHAEWTWARLDAAFARAPSRVRRWRSLVVANSDAHGETLVRLWCGDAGIPFLPQPFVQGVGWLDGRVSPNTYVEIDGAQHDEGWVGGSASSFEHDHERDVGLAILGKRSIRLTYRQIYRDWPTCLRAIVEARRLDLELLARRRRHPMPRARPSDPTM